MGDLPETCLSTIAVHLGVIELRGFRAASRQVAAVVTEETVFEAWWTSRFRTFHQYLSVRQGILKASKTSGGVNYE